MKILLADDNPIGLRILEACARAWGFEPVSARTGLEALEILKKPDRPHLCILDWMMPGMDGPDVCREVRSIASETPLYIILVTAKIGQEHVVEGLTAGADDYMTKPFNRSILNARLRVGARILRLQQSLREKVDSLQETMDKVKNLEGLLPICAWCKKIRDTENYWHRVEKYFADNTDAGFTHCICPSCLEREEARMSAQKR